MEMAAKRELTPLKMEHGLLFVLGVCLIAFGQEVYAGASPVGQVVILIIFLGLLVGIAPLPMPVFKSLFWQTYFAGLLSGVLDSFIVLEQCKRLRTVEKGQTREEVMHQQDNQETEGVRAKLLALFMIAALVGGLVIWFGEVYAAGTYLNDGRTGILSALYIVPPVLVFLAVLGFHATRLPIEVVPNKAAKASMRDVIEFIAGVAALLMTHNPLLCLGGLLVYSVLTRQDEHLLDAWKHHTEVNVMLVLLVALIAGSWIVANVISPLGLDKGEYLPIIPAGVQAVLWGPLYTDPTVHFWMRITTLATGALILPISSLVGVMLFKSLRQWWMYMKYSIPYAILFYLLMRGWIWLTLESPVGHALEQWAHSGGHH
tara:strand:- start:45432 stop:46550 length:1119 start_codon:yes stop_codon:yes gene_type:complete